MPAAILTYLAMDGMPESLTGDEPKHDATRLVLVTGPSGAGRTTAIRALEDLGYEAIDNLPLSLLPRLLDGPGRASRWRSGSTRATAIFRPSG